MRDRLPIKLRIGSEISALWAFFLRPFGYRRIADCMLCGRRGFSMDPRDQNNIFRHVVEYHGDDLGLRA